MSAKDWYARKLNVAPPQQQQHNLPPMVGSPSTPAAHVGAPIPAPMHQHVRGGFVAGPDGKVDMVSTAATWSGGKGNADAERCPNCGKESMFGHTAAATGIVGRSMAPARQCYECGYPVVQFGSPNGLGEQIAAGMTG